MRHLVTVASLSGELPMRSSRLRRVYIVLIAILTDIPVVRMSIGSAILIFPGKECIARRMFRGRAR